jgi:DNA (cytosine-5)-methyltransferase 1
MGQGRFVHPAYPRTLTPHEAARLQTFPDWFTFESVTTRKGLATMIANAVPPAAAEVICGALLEQLALSTGPRSGIAA